MRLGTTQYFLHHNKPRYPFLITPKKQNLNIITLDIVDKSIQFGPQIFQIKP